MGGHPLDPWVPKLAFTYKLPFWFVALNPTMFSQFLFVPLFSIDKRSRVQHFRISVAAQS
jgi:hypothetical protein